MSEVCIFRIAIVKLSNKIIHLCMDVRRIFVFEIKGCASNIFHKKRGQSDIFLLKSKTSALIFENLRASFRKRCVQKNANIWT